MIEKIGSTNQASKPVEGQTTTVRNQPSPAPHADQVQKPAEDRVDLREEAAEPSPSPGPEAKAPDLQVGNMNLGGGNKEARANFDKIKKTVGEQVVRNGIDVATFQEVDVGTRRAGGKDYNKEILSSVFEADMGGHDTHPVGDNKYETTLPNGEKATVTITQEKPEDDNGDVTVYTASYKNEKGEDVQYQMVHGRSIDHDGGTFGNSVLLGPGQTLPRDQDGKIPADAIKVHEVGDDRGARERRTALEVNTADGQTVLSTHLTAGSDDWQQKARSAEYRSLDQIAKGKPDVILGGDLNSAPGDTYSTGGIFGWNPFGREYKYPEPGDMGFKEATDGDGLDHILVRGATPRGEHSVDGIESVHDFQWVDVKR